MSGTLDDTAKRKKVAPPVATPEVTTDEPEIYTTGSLDSVEKIAQERYGSPLVVAALCAANPHIPSLSGSLRVGDNVLLPVSLVGSDDVEYERIDN